MSAMADAYTVDPRAVQRRLLREARQKLDELEEHIA